MFKRLAFAAALSLSASVAFAGDPVGRYEVQGTGPDGGNYKGTAVIALTGETYQVSWQIAGQKFVGTAVGNEKFFAVAYRSGNDTGIAVYGAEGDDWVGVWTYAGGKKTGVETLRRR